MITDPAIIGYWARMNDLRYEDICDHGKFSRYISPEADPNNKFGEGWDKCDEELLNDLHESQIDALLEDLAELETAPALVLTKIDPASGETLYLTDNGGPGHDRWSANSGHCTSWFCRQDAEKKAASHGPHVNVVEEVTTPA